MAKQKTVMGVRAKDLAPKPVKPKTDYTGRGTRARLETAARKIMFGIKAST